jgi:chromosome segregation ATPase
MITNASQNAIHKTDMLDPTSNNTAISLWYKFATWQSEMDQCRTKVKSVCDEQDQIRSQIKDLIRIREDEQRKIKEMEAFKESFNESSTDKLNIPKDIPSLERLRELRRTLDRVEEQYRNAATALGTTQQTVHNTKQRRHHMLQQYINDNSHFHLKCRQVQYDLMEAVVASSQRTDAGSLEKEGTLCMVHTLHAVLCAKIFEQNTNTASNGKSRKGDDDHWISTTINELQNHIAMYDSIFIDSDDSLDDNDPTVWKVSKEKDLELYRAVELYEQQRAKYTILEEETKQLQSTYETMYNKTLDRDRRKMNLQTQLQRIQGDCTLIESKIDQCKEMTAEDEALVQTYRISELLIFMCFCIGFFYQNSWSYHFKHIILFHTSLCTFFYSRN